jgi:imidazolonepropionase-like amidohydrolase
VLPGLIDSQVHTDVKGLRDALAFGVTTELEMQGHWSLKKRREIAERDEIADLRTSGIACRRGGHPRRQRRLRTAPDPGRPGAWASLHHELQLLVQGGFTPVEALRAATSVPARRFSLMDRGRIAPGARADLLLVNGDPTVSISDTLSTHGVWRRGVLQKVD